MTDQRSAAPVDYSEMFEAARNLREWLLSDGRPYYALVVAALIDKAQEAVDAAPR